MFLEKLVFSAHYSTSLLLDALPPSLKNIILNKDYESILNIKSLLYFNITKL
jgi:hypothetical protein